MVLCPGLCNSRSFPPLGLRAREGVGFVETDKLSDKSSDHQSRDMASPWQPWYKVAGGNTPTSYAFLPLVYLVIKQGSALTSLIDFVEVSLPRYSARCNGVKGGFVGAKTAESE